MKKRRFGHIGIPLQRIHIELTNVCDFNCLFCPKALMKRLPGYMDADLAKRIIDEIGENRLCEKITFHVMGEPTLHPRFFDILSHARDRGLKVGLTTNGATLGTDVGKRLLAFPLHQIDVSLQTPDPDSFRLRKSRALSFDAYVRGVLRFFQAYRAAWPETTFKFRFLNTRFHKKGIEKKVGPVEVISSTEALRATFSTWANKIYDILEADQDMRKRALARIENLVSYKWNVAEILPHVHFETYVLEDWGNAFEGEKIRDAWAGYCFGMRDHFSILHNGDVTLCCVDFDGKTAVGNLRHSSLREILSSDEVGKIVKGFRRLKLVHPYCRHCLGSRSFASWLFKPVLSVTVLKALKPFFYKRTKLYR
jgi:MoaA/NifB/PqqE/SkfB family radical SAM enzyme